MNGGADIISYELSFYDKKTEEWLSIAGGQNNFSLLNTKVYAEGIVKGDTYQLRYRAWNINGPGEFSETGYIKAA